MRIKTQREPDSQNGAGKEQGVRFCFRDRHFDGEKNQEGGSHDEALIPGESMIAIETARAEIDRDRADHPDCVKTGESVEVFRCQKHQDWKGNSRDQRKLRNAVTIQSCELLWHLAVLR